MSSGLYLICFDIHEEARLRNVAILLENHGQRVQKSVFECYLNDTEKENLKNQLKHLIDPQQDKINIYPLCQKDEKKITTSNARYTRPTQGHFIV